MRVFWFSPLPPAKTDIANYTARVAPALQESLNLVLVHPTGTKAGPEFDAIDASSIDWRSLNEADYCIYHIGNDAQFHSAIFAIARSHPGIVVLHDRAINECFLDMLAARERLTGERPDREYRTAMAEWYGIAGLDMADAVLRGATTASSIARLFPLFELALHRARGVICHNPVVSRELSARFPKLPLIDLALPYPSPSERMNHDKRFSADTPIQLVAFGFMGLNRRLAQFIDVWRQSPWRHRFRLDIAGELSERWRLERMLTEAGLHGQVRFRGFIADAALDQMIREAHLAINLRNPSMGEASGSQMRIWANGTASAVSDTGWYSLLPDDCVRKISIDNEADDLMVLLAELADGRFDVQAAGNAGFQRLKTHDPHAYAAKLASWLRDEQPAMERRWTESALIESMAGAYAGFLPQQVLPPLPPALLDRVS